MTTTPIRFEAQLHSPAAGGDWLFLRLPQDASDRLSARSQVSVDASINGFQFVATLEPDGEGGHWLKLLPKWIAGASVRVRDVVEVVMSQTAVEPEPEVPEDLRDALAIAPAASETWNSTTAIARRDWIQWMTSGKKAETRQIRLTNMIDMLSKGKRRVCCFDRSGLASKGFRCPDAAE